ncbi:UNVERIFIED_CONTAM: putative mitochondrial protein [Sesamum indicum]
MSATAGGLSPPVRSYRDAVAGAAVRPPPPPVSFETSSFRPMGVLSRDQGMKVLRFSSDEISRLSLPFRYALVGKFSHGYPSMQNLRRWMLAQGFRGDFSVGAINVRHVFIKFALEEDYTKLWIKSIWFVEGFPMRVFKWTPTFNPREESPIVPVWVRLPELPIQFFDREALFSIAHLLGTPLRTDVSTATLVRPSVARVCVEINLLEPLQTEIGLGIGTEVIIQPVIYERLPKYCGACKHLGHDEDECYEKHRSKAPPVRPANKDDSSPPIPDQEDLRVKLDALRAQKNLRDRRKGKRVAFDDGAAQSRLGASTSGSKEAEGELQEAAPQKDESKTEVDEVVHLPEDEDDGMVKDSHVTKVVDSHATLTDERHSRNGKETAVPEVLPKVPELGESGPSDTRPDDEQVDTCVVPASQTASLPCELPGCVVNTSDHELPNCAAVTDDEALGQTGEGVIQMDEEDVSRRLARHRRGRSMGDAPTDHSASPDRGKAVSPPRRIVTRRLFWNVRGIGNDPTQRVLNRVRKQHHLDFLAIMEPMISLEGRFMARRLGFKEVVSNCVNQIWFFWGPEVQCRVLIDHEQFLHLPVYAKCDMVERRDLWASLRLISVGSSPWIVGGDFNTVLCPEERSGGAAPSGIAMSDFHDMIADCALTDAGYTGSPYTWYSRRLRQRLDRVLVTDSWMDVFSKTQVTHLELSKSDHRGLLVVAETIVTQKASSFRFQHMWITHPGFLEVVRRNWQYPTIGSGMVRPAQFLGVLSPSQSGFVPGRLLSDNVLLAQELVHSLESRRSEANVIFKLDMAKAYDRVNWEFLFQVLRLKGFPQHWINLVANAVSNCWFSVLVNGEHAGFFHSTRGLRQGDPLSPALFVLAADYLSQGLNRLFVAHPTMYYQSPGRVRVSHLAYADDMMIFTNICRQHMELLRDFLHAYERVSGQRINSAKSSFILSRQVPLSQLQEVQYVMGYQLKYLPVTYLGVPLYKGNRKACLFDSLISRIRDMLQGWAMTNLSHGGRLALIRSVLQAMPLHLLQVIHPPKSVLITIERIFNGFFWGSYNGRRHIHWCSWDKICRPVAEGGLGIRSLAEYVRAFSMKLWWRFRLKSSLWSEYLHDRYCRALHPTHVPYNRNHSSVWHRLCRIRDVAEPLIFWTLGQGAVSFWHDNWFGEKPLAQLVRGAPDTMEPVCYYWHEGEWNVPKIFRIVPPQIAHIICRIPIAAGQRDRIVWTATSNGTFSTASAWEAIRVASPRRQLFTDIWHRSLRPTVSVFLWRLFQDWIPVDERMKRKGFSFASKCQCCEAEESISHLFVEGEVVREVWLHFANVFGLQLCETGDLVNLVHFWRYSTPFHSDLHIRTLVPFLILWSTWTQRNAAKYHGAHFTATGTILEVQRHLRTLYAARIMTSIQWKGDLHRALAMGFCFRPIAPQAPRVVRWSTPSPAWFKLNSDGSSLGNPGPAAAAGIIRDADGQVRLAYQFALGTATSVVSELTAVWRGLELARAHSLAPIVVEVDATVVLQLLQSRASGIWEVQHLIMRIVQLQQELGSDVRHIFREANGAADHLAKDAASRQLTRVMYQEDITGVLRGIIRLDKMGTPYLRRWTLGWAGRSASGVHRSSRPFCRRCAPGLNWPGRASGAVTLKKLECSKQAYALYTLAWDNIIGFRSYYVGLRDRTFAKDVFINQERKLGARRRSDTVLVSTINDADQGSADVAFRTPPAPYEKSKSLGSGGSMVARLKLKGIDGRAPPGVEPAA